MRIRARWAIPALTGLALLLLARILLPFYLEYRSDRALAQIEGLTGTVGNIDLFLLAGQGRIEDLLVENRDPPTGAEHGSGICPEILVDWSWWNLIRGHIHCTVHLANPQILVAESKVEDKEEKGEGEEDLFPPETEQSPAIDSGLMLSLPELVPFTIDRLSMEGGTLRYLDLGNDPLVDLMLTDLTVLLSDLTNVPQAPEVDLPSTLMLTASTPGAGELAVDARFDPLAEAVRADIDARLTDVDMRAINDLLMAHADLDVESGTLQLYAEAAIAEGRYDGYVKVMVHDLDVFSWRGDSEDGILQKFKEALAGGAGEILENQSEGQQAIRIPISGDVSGAGTDLGKAISSVLANAFISAMRPGVEGQVQYEDVDDVAVTGETR